MTMPLQLSTGEDSPELNELFRSIRFVARYLPNTVLKLTAAVDVLRSSMPKAKLSAERIEICRLMGRDVDEVALIEGASSAVASADKQLIARMPRERIQFLQAFTGGTDVAAMAARARAVGWDRDTPNYPTPQR